MAEKRQYQFRLDDEFLIALGRITYGSSYVETVVSTTFQRLLSNDPEVGRRVTADATFRWLVDHTRVLAAHRLPSGLAGDVSRWLNRCTAAYADRSEIVHSGWYVDLTGGELRHGLMRESARKREFHQEYRLIDPSDLHDIAFELEAAGLEGVGLISAVIAVVGPFVDED